MPAGRAFVFAFCIAVILAAGAAVPWLVPVAAVLDVLLVVAVGVDHARSRRTPLTASRSWPPLLVQGGTFPLEVTVSTTSPAAVGLVLREGLHPAVAEGPRRTRIALAAAGATRWRLELTPRSRGQHAIAPLVARVAGPWGLCWSQRVLLPAESRRIYPQVRWEGRVGRLLELARRRELGREPLRLHGVGAEPYALREYLPGDPRSRIHWKATARHGRLVSREDAWERGGRVVVLLDCARAMASLDGAASKLDHALAAALVLVRVSLARGDQVTVIAFSDRLERHVRVHGNKGVAAAYGALYDLEARLVEPSYDVAAEAAIEAQPRSALVVLLTSLVDLGAARLLREAILRLRRRHRPLLVNLEDADVRRLAQGVPETQEDAFSKTSALAILLSNRDLARTLRHGGVHVLTAPADAVAAETLDAYLRLRAH